MRILIVDDEPIVRRDLERLLKLEADIDVVGMAANGLDTLDRKSGRRGRCGRRR